MLIIEAAQFFDVLDKRAMQDVANDPASLFEVLHRRQELLGSLHWRKLRALLVANNTHGRAG